MAGLRFSVAGVILYIVMRSLGAPNPTLKQWLGASVVGLLLPAMGNGTVCFVQQTISSSVAALSIATAPIWMAIFSSIGGRKVSCQEWLGVAFGLVGISMLNLGGSLHGDVVSALLLILAAASWSFGSVWGSRLEMPKGLMASATQMLAGGLILMLVSVVHGESWPQSISVKSWFALLFLIVLGSLVAYSAYLYLLRTVRPLVASSNTFINPIVAFIVGIWLAQERVENFDWMALMVILVGVFLVLSATSSLSDKKI